MLSKSTPDGTTSYGYFDNLKTAEDVSGGDNRSFTYDADANMLTASNPAGTYSFGYDNDNRMTSVSEPFGTSLTYGYDAASNQTSITDNFGGSVTSTYVCRTKLWSQL